MANVEEITFETTNNCNNKCLHCSTEASPEGRKELTLTQVTDICDYYRPKWANLSGGEPLLSRNIFNIIKQVKRRDINIRLYTSGNINTRILDKALKLGVDKVIFGVESINPQAHDYITQSPGSFIKTMYNLKHTIDNGINAQVHLVPIKQNKEDLDKTLETLQSLKVERVSLLKLVVQGRVRQNKHIIPDKNIVETINDLKEKYGDFVRLGSPFDYSVPCAAGIGKLVLTSDYVVTPCETFKSGRCYCERGNREGLEMSLKLHSFFEQYDIANKNIGIPWAESKNFLVQPDIKDVLPKRNFLSRLRGL